MPKLRYQVVRGNHEVMPGVERSLRRDTQRVISRSLSSSRTAGRRSSQAMPILPRNLDTPILPGVYVDARRYAESADRLKNLVDTRG